MKKKDYKILWETLGLLLLFNGLAQFFLWFWQILFILTHPFGYLNLFFALFDIYLAYAFLKNKKNAKKILFLRILLGSTAWLFVFYIDGTTYGLLWAKIGVLAALGLLALGKIKLILLTLFCLSFILLDIFTTTHYITHKQELLMNLKKYGIPSYFSKKHGYLLNAPSEWKIIKQKDIPEVRKSLSETEAEIALISKDAISFCLIIPTRTDKFTKKPEIGKIKRISVSNLSSKRNTKVIRFSDFIDKNKGFEIEYTDIIEGNRQDYLIIYIRKEDFDLKLIGWTLSKDKEKIYNEIRKIAKKFIKNPLVSENSQNPHLKPQ